MNRPSMINLRRQVPGERSDLGSPTSPVNMSSGNNDDDRASDYESSAEEALNPSAPRSLLVNDPFSSDASKILFESIDRIRKNGASKHLDLPQLVIVGKQSAGKSSLLQSLTDIPFPVGSKLCTRFATRIVSKRSGPNESEWVRASVEPGDVNPFNYSEDESDIEIINQSSISSDKFENIVEVASSHMGISENRNFSSKVLKIELTGPQRSHFGILDVPGVFSSTTRGVTDEEMNGVTRMVESYMKKPENIIILVGDATDDLANQSIFKLAENLNVDSSRMVAVFTKCDRAQVPENIVQTVKEGDGIAGKSLRWHVVRNRDPNAPPSFNREEAEAALFNQHPWLEIPEDRRGTPNLKKYLGRLLCMRIRQGFPTLQGIIRDKLREQEARLESLGQSRESPAQQLDYLRNIVKTYEDLAGKALRSPAELSSNQIKLRGFTQTRNAEFAKMMVKMGHMYQFLEIGQEVESDWSPAESEFDPEPRTIAVPLNDYPPSPEITPQRRRRLTPRPPAGHISRQVTPRPTTVNPLYAEIREQIEANRGEELPGMLNPAVLKPLWVKQTSRWYAHGEAHLKELVSQTTDVAIKIFSEVTKVIEMSERTRHKLERVITGAGSQAREKVLIQLRDLCHQNATLALQTNNPQFEQRVNAARALRFRGALERYRKANPPDIFLAQLLSQGQGQSSAYNVPLNFNVNEQWAIVDSSSITKLFDEIHPYGERAQNTQDEIHDLLKAYYDIALQNFIHDIEFSIVEPFLQDKNGPLLGLSTDYILSLRDREVEEFGGEDASIIEQRRDANIKIKKLTEAMNIADDAWTRTMEVGRVGA